MRKLLLRQGDVLFIKDGKKDAKATVKAEKPIVALGESSGHFHGFTGGATVLTRPGTPSWGRHVEIEVPDTIKHQEHKPIPFEPGSYEVRHQRTYSRVGMRRVTD